MITNLTEEKLRRIVDEAIDQNQTSLKLKQDQLEMKRELHRQGIIQGDMQKQHQVTFGSDHATIKQISGDV